ncbi:rhamnulokinase [Listeria grandensis]|uniref:Rhamnulokinase n=1 Tax=Listeria grandensis TaxID=1494963 RepID=A0A7X0Y5U8_9LIST|nr:rhamnulokinase [Listeria grandensis]MBC1937589.1 rhamnulokinase [Listeria grandensis]
MKHVAVDVGASSGRLLLGELVDGKMELTEIHRFQNGFTKVDDCCIWNIDHILTNIMIGLEKLKASGVTHCTLGIDTWAVDYCLVGYNGKRLHEVVSYRDKRTDRAMDAVLAKFSATDIYDKTGIQFLQFNSLYQLYVEDAEFKKRAETVMMVPDYLGYLLTGERVTEVTNASSTQMLNLHTRQFDADLLGLVGLYAGQFARFAKPGEMLGEVAAGWHDRYDLPDCDVIVVATHDTASAVLGAPGVGDDWAFLSSGTWSLLGAELANPINSAEAFAANYTNEWGAYDTFRFLKNIMGLWLIQEVARMQDYAYSYAELAELAAREEAFAVLIGVDDHRFLNPTDMIAEIQAYCAETGQEIPRTPGKLARVIYDSLAVQYAIQIEQLQTLTGQEIRHLHIIGGGANIAILNQLTADLTGIAVHAGPTEATGLGNLAVQLIASGEAKDIMEVRELIRKSTPMTTYMPGDGVHFMEIQEKYKNISGKQEAF